MFRAIGFVFGLIAIRVLAPDVFHEAEHALISIFRLVSDIYIHVPTDVTVDATRMTAGYMVQPN